MRIVFVHGSQSSPSQAFWPWLYDELSKRGHEVIAPELPSAEAPDCAAWVEAIDQSIHRPGGDTIFIAHSLGCVALLHYFERADMSGTPKSTILIAPPYHIGSEKFASFFQPMVDFDTVEWKSQEFVIVHAKDDATIPLEHSQQYERFLNASLNVLETGGHFSKATSLPLLLELIDRRDTVPGESLHNDFSDIDIVV